MKKLSYILLIIFFAGVILFSFEDFAIADVSCAGEGQSCITSPGYDAPEWLICCPGLTCKSDICQKASAITTKCPGTTCPAGQICIENPLCAESFEDLLNAIVNFIFWVALAVAPMMIMIAAFFLLTAAGNPQRVDKAKQIILWTVIGLAIILLAKGLISVLRQIIGVK